MINHPLCFFLFFAQQAILWFHGSQSIRTAIAAAATTTTVNILLGWAVKSLDIYCVVVNMLATDDVVGRYSLMRKFSKSTRDLEADRRRSC